MEVLDGPHLVLAHIRGDHGVHRHEPRDGVRDLLGGQGASAFVVFRFRLEGENVILPRGVIHRLKLVEQHLQHALRIADDVVVGLHVFVDLRAVDVDLHDLGLACKACRVKCHAVGEAAAHGDEQVTAVAGHVGGLGAVHADHARGERVAPLEAAAAHEGHGNGRVDALRKFQKLAVRPAAHHAAAADEEGLLGSADHFDQLVHVMLIRLRCAQVVRSALDERAEPPFRSMRLPGQGRVFRHLRGRVFHDVDEHRPRPAAAGDGECFAHDVRELCSVAHHVIALGDGHGDARDVNFLEGVLAHEVFRHVAGDEHHGGRIHVGRGDARGKVGAPRAGGGKAHAHFAGGTGIAVRRVGSALLVRGQDVPDLAAVAVKLIINIQNGAAGVAENGIDALFEQAFHQNFCACHLHV